MIEKPRSWIASGEWKTLKRKKCYEPAIGWGDRKREWNGERKGLRSWIGRGSHGVDAALLWGESKVFAILRHSTFECSSSSSILVRVSVSPTHSKSKPTSAISRFCFSLLLSLNTMNNNQIINTARFIFILSDAFYILFYQPIKKKMLWHFLN